MRSESFNTNVHFQLHRPQQHQACQLQNDEQKQHPMQYHLDIGTIVNNQINSIRERERENGLKRCIVTGSSTSKYCLGCGIASF
jgi:hypothetical protein